MSVTIKIREMEPFDSGLKRFTLAVKHSGIIQLAIKKSRFEKPSTKRNRKKQKQRRRNKVKN